MRHVCKFLEMVKTFLLCMLIVLSGIVIFTHPSKEYKNENHIKDMNSIPNLMKQEDFNKHILDIKADDHVTVTINRTQDTNYYVVAQKVNDSKNQSYITLSDFETTAKDNCEIIPFNQKESSVTFELNEGTYDLICISKDAESKLQMAEIIDISVSSLIYNNETDYFLPCD